MIECPELEGSHRDQCIQHLVLAEMVLEGARSCLLPRNSEIFLVGGREGEEQRCQQGCGLGSAQGTGSCTATSSTRTWLRAAELIRNRGEILDKSTLAFGLGGFGYTACVWVRSHHPKS